MLNQPSCHRSTGTAVTIGLVALAILASACGSPPGSPTPPPSAPPTVVAPPIIVSVVPNRGSVGGGAVVTIAGTGFHPTSTVTVGGGGATVAFESSTKIRVTVPAHGLGSVEVVVTNPDSQAARLGDGFTFVSADSFDFNGTWEGSALAHPIGVDGLVPTHSDMGIAFTVQNNRVTSVNCGLEEVTLSAPLAVSSGEFSLLVAGAVMISGRVVSDTGAVGTIDTPACPGTRWSVARK